MVGGMLSGAMGGATVAIIIRAVDQYSGELRKAETGMQKLGTAAKIGALGFAAAFGLAAKEAAKFEQTKVAFTTMIGSAGKAEKFLKSLTNFAKSTPFTISGVEESAKKLMAYGVATEDVIDVMRTLGDISSGVGTDKMPQLILALGQVKAKTVLAGQELRQFTETGIPLVAELATVTGHSMAEISDQTKDLRITYEQVLQALENMSGEGGKFANMMGKQFGTAEQVVSNFGDEISILARTFGKELLPSIKYVVGGLSDMLSAFNELPEGLKSTISKGAAIGGAGVIAAGAGYKIAELLRGSVALPMHTFETNPSAMGGGIGGKVAKGAGALALGAGALATGASVYAGSKVNEKYGNVAGRAMGLINPAAGLAGSLSYAKEKFMGNRPVAEQGGGVGVNPITGMPMNLGGQSSSPTNGMGHLEGMQVQQQQELSTLTDEQLSELKDVMDTERERTLLLGEQNKQLEENGFVNAESTFAIEENSRALAEQRGEARGAGVILRDFNNVIIDFAQSALEASIKTKTAALSTSRGGKSYSLTGDAAAAKHADMFKKSERAFASEGRPDQEYAGELGVDEYGNRLKSNQVATGTKGSDYGAGKSIVMTLYNQANPAQVARDVANEMVSNEA